MNLIQLEGLLQLDKLLISSATCFWNWMTWRAWGLTSLIRRRDELASKTQRIPGPVTQNSRTSMTWWPWFLQPTDFQWRNFNSFGFNNSSIFFPDSMNSEFGCSKFRNFKDLASTSTTRWTSSMCWFFNDCMSIRINLSLLELVAAGIQCLDELGLPCRLWN